MTLFAPFHENITIIDGSSSQFLGGDSMKSKTTREKIQVLGVDNKKPNLPSFSETVQSVLNTGQSIHVEGTNVVRVPFGIRQPLKQRPQRPDHWATIVLPLQPGSPPPTPPQAA